MKLWSSLDMPLAVAYAICIYSTIYFIGTSADAVTRYGFGREKICLPAPPGFGFTKFKAELRHYNCLHVSVISSRSSYYNQATWLLRRLHPVPCHV